MARLVFLDAEPLGLLAKPRGKPDVARCRQWAADPAAAGVPVVVPEIADDEVRRKLLHVGATAGITRLDRLGASLDYAPITTAAMRKAAELWAQARRAGRPTAGDKALDAAVILAAMALTAAGPGDVVTVATINVAHLGRFLDARPWDQARRSPTAGSSAAATRYSAIGASVSKTPCASRRPTPRRACGPGPHPRHRRDVLRSADGAGRRPARGAHPPPSSPIASTGHSSSAARQAASSAASRGWRTTKL